MKCFEYISWFLVASDSILDRLILVFFYVYLDRGSSSRAELCSNKYLTTLLCRIFTIKLIFIINKVHSKKLHLVSLLPILSIIIISIPKDGLRDLPYEVVVKAPFGMRNIEQNGSHSTNGSHQLS